MAAGRSNNLVKRCWSAIAWLFKWLTGRLKKEDPAKDKADKVARFVEEVRKPSVVEVVIGRRRKRLPAKVIKENHHTVWVMLPSGDVIERDKLKHVISDGLVKQVQLGRDLSWEQIEEYANA